MKSFQLHPEVEDKQLGSLLRQKRKERSITLNVLAMRTGLTQGYLSKVERGLSSPSIASLSRVVSALGIKLTDLFEHQYRDSSLSIVGPNDRKTLTRDAQPFGYSYESLAFKKHDKLMEPFVITLIPNAQEKKLFVHKGEEMMFLLEGKLELTYGNERYIIEEPGTCIYFDSSIPHRGDSHGDKEARLLVVLSMQHDHEEDSHTHGSSSI
jgi:transcriptional regulator with XRE-family HTH domain